eukprot:1378730-Amorphochlora_amoeboformis.AAC.1
MLVGGLPWLSFGAVLCLGEEFEGGECVWKDGLEGLVASAEFRDRVYQVEHRASVCKPTHQDGAMYTVK